MSRVKVGVVSPDDVLLAQDITICGGAGGIRTLYLFNAIEALSQLSYSPHFTLVAASKQISADPNRKIVAQGYLAKEIDLVAGPLKLELDLS